MAVYRPGSWFDETLAALAAQDYPNLHYLFFVVHGEGEDSSSDDRVAELLASSLPGAVVRRVAGNPGFGPLMNEFPDSSRATAASFV